MTVLQYARYFLYIIVEVGVHCKKYVQKGV